ncbi:MAG: class I SAM-dependent methyltransferase, partial [Nitrososphaera sp.]
DGGVTVKDSWSNSEAYERYVGRWSSRVGESFLDWLNARKNARWLDIGCGTGALSERILRSQEPSHLIGVEPSEAFLAAAKERVQGENVEFRSGSGESLPVQDACIEYAVSGLVLNFVPDKDGAMRELLRVLAPGGIAACYVWDYAGHVQFMRYFWDAAVKLDPSARDKDEGVRFPICRPKPLRNLFESVGLREVRVAAIDIPTPFESFDDYWQPFLADVAPAPGYCVSLDREHRAKLEALVRDALPLDPDGMILLAARAWAVAGVRP